MSSNERLYYPIENVKNTFSKVSISSFYKVAFQLSNNGGLINWLAASGIYDRATSNGLDPIESIELLCSGAILPGTSFKMSEVMGNRQGVLEKYPVFKQYPELALTFYVDNNHKVIKFFEEWTNFISPLYNASSGQVRPTKNGLNPREASSENGYFKLRYPDDYTQTIYITKFERDLNTLSNDFRFTNSPTLSYKFIKAYPNNIVASPVSYNGTDILSYTVTFVYSRYVVLSTDKVFGSSILISDTPTQSVSTGNVGTLNINNVDQVFGRTIGFDANIA
jgi:hypothetical protein